MLTSETTFFLGFAAFVMVVMALDLGVFTKQKSHVVHFKEAAIWSAVWVSLSIAFYFFIKNYGYLVHGINDFARLQEVRNLYADHVQLIPGDFEQSLQLFQNNMALEYITGYLVEYSLSADNIFVFILIFASFGVRERYYKKILVWGILGAIVLRFVFIFVGSALLQRFEWIMFVFGAFLVYTGVRLFFEKEGEEQIDTKNHPVVKLVSKYFNVYRRNVIDHFFVRRKTDNKLFVTPLFIVVVVVAFTDLVFAVDSIPAIFSITKDPYIVFFSNVFAIMGLRSMFFFLSSIMSQFRFLKVGLAVLLTFIGVKMLTDHYLEELGFKPVYSLYIIVSILAVSVLASWLIPEKKAEKEQGIEV
ncbi:TerC/Alx family metal homeostasis membrane protein [Rudanella paleaurantiibacter]|uniref:TerC/Alx family metal homeostasis membrane protein n=1 Tax=Rudanella paleaurantiibacter TaxID=2614655 RepID=A0A7J5TUD7_9BACT|nr:TerC/Alx family metal homeostasis membrane protein [Rudanella paleaurantiibacter]KAB7726110.1 TerC/Alx family metal homeostasis membrane protein [Rudanella paleaurantiibacter]